MTYTIRPAQAVDVDALIELRTDAEQWLRQHGIQQWTDDFSAYARGALRQAVADGAAWVVVDDGQAVIATVSLSTHADQDFWGWLDSVEQDTALYVGKIIVSTRLRSLGLGDAILNWAADRAAHEGRDWVRLDVRRDNAKLQAYYLTRGFTHLRIWHRPGRRTASGWLAQRAAGTALPAQVALTAAAGPIATAPIGAVASVPAPREEP